MEINKIYNEDCLITMKKMSDDFVSHSVTSPPYNFNLRIHLGKYAKRSVKETTKYSGSYSDDLSVDEYYNWQKGVIEELLRVTKGCVFYNIQMLTGNKVALMRLLGYFSESVKEIIIWDKIHSEPAMGEGILNSEFEFVIIFSKNNAISRQFPDCNFDRGTISNMFRIPKNTSSGVKSHNAAFPRRLPYKIISLFTKQNDLIYDPFMGTGQVGMVCHELKRNFIGSEISEDYFNISNKRIKNLQAQKTMF